MWHWLKNFFSSLRTYNDLSPDLWVRRRVNWMLRDRPALSLPEWFELFYQTDDIAPEIAQFVYVKLEQYSGLRMASVLPGDRLIEDLCWIQVCWFDWELSLCEDFHHCFGVEIGDRLDFSELNTLKDLICFLNQQIQSLTPPEIR